MNCIHFKMALIALTFSCAINLTVAQNVGIGTTTPTNKLSVVGKANITDSLGIGIANAKAKLDVLGGTLLRGINTNPFNTPLLAGVEYFTGRGSLGGADPNQASQDVAFNWGGAGGGYRHFIETRHDVYPGNGNALAFYINNSGTSAGSSSPGAGNDMQMAITGSGIGVGTSNPHASAQMEFNTTNKGLLLPRLNDTSSVAGPAEGLMIYNKALKSPSFFNGSRWQSLETTSSATTPDSINYTISAPANGFNTGTFKLLSETQDVNLPLASSGGGTVPGKAQFTSMTFTKTTDINSTIFIKSLTAATNINAFIEIKFYKPGATTPYYSVKGTTFYVTGFTLNTATGGLVETISITPIIFGYKDWVNSNSWAWNVSTNVSTTY